MRIRSANPLRGGSVVHALALAGCTSSTDLPGTVDGVVFDEDVVCDGADCGDGGETFEASAMLGEDASGFAPRGVYVYAWFWRQDGRFVEIEMDVPHESLAAPETVVVWREWDGDEPVFDGLGPADLTIEGMDDTGEIAGTFSAQIEDGSEIRDVVGGHFVTEPPPNRPGMDWQDPTETPHEDPPPQHDPEPSDWHEPTDSSDPEVDVYVEGGCGCYVEDPAPEEDVGGGGGCEGDTTGDEYDSGGGGSGCEGDTAPSDEAGGGGCEGESAGDSGCEGDAAAATTGPARGTNRILRQIWAQSFPFASVGAGIAWLRRRRRKMQARAIAAGNDVQGIGSDPPASH